MLAFHRQGVPTFDYGNNIRQVAHDEESPTRSRFRFRAGLHPAAFLRRQGSVPLGRAVGDPEDIYKTDRKVLELFPDNAHLERWLGMAKERIAFQGLPARICWLGLGERHSRASRSTRW
jgi:urocanate hydratase